MVLRIESRGIGSLSVREGDRSRWYGRHVWTAWFSVCRCREDLWWRWGRLSCSSDVAWQSDGKEGIERVRGRVMGTNEPV